MALDLDPRTVLDHGNAGDDLTHRLLHAAAEVFAEKGYEKAGVAEIARRAGVTTGAIYSRYAGKAELLLDAVDHHVPDRIERLLRADDPADSPTEVLSSLGDHLLDDLPEGYGLFLEAIVAARRDPGLAESLRRRVDEEERQLGGLIRQAQADGLVDTELDELAVVRLAHAIGFGMTLTRAMGLDLPTAEGWHAVIDGVIAGLAVQPTDGPDSTTTDPATGDPA